MNNFTLQKRSKKMLLHQRAISAETITTTNHNVSWPLCIKQAAKITFAQLKGRTLQSTIYWPKKTFTGTGTTWNKVIVRCCLAIPFLQSEGMSPTWNTRIRNLRKNPTHWHFKCLTEEISNMSKAGGSQRVIKEMITGSLFLYFCLFPPRPPFSIPFTFASSPLSESLEQATIWPHAQFCWKNSHMKKHSVWGPFSSSQYGQENTYSTARKCVPNKANAAMTVITMECLLTELGPAKWENFGPCQGTRTWSQILSCPALSLSQKVHISLLIERGLIKAREEEKPVVGGMDRDAQWKIRIEPLKQSSLGIALALFDS